MWLCRSIVVRRLYSSVAFELCEDKMANELGSERQLGQCVEFCLKLAAALFSLVVAWAFFVRGRNRRLPPGPFPLPIIGNLHMLGKLPHQALAALSLKFGSLMSLRLGSVLTLVVSSPEMAKEFLKTHDLLFVSRPLSSAAKRLRYNSSIIRAPYGPYWRQMRKLCVSQLLNSARLDYFRGIRDEEVSAMILSIVNSDHPVNIAKSASILANSIICRMIFGRKLSEEDSIDSRIISTLQESLLLAGAFNIGDCIPYLDWMDLQGVNRRMQKVHRVLDALLEKIIEEHVWHNADTSVTRDLVDVLLAASADKDTEFQITRESIKAIIYDMVVAATDTSSTSIEWAMSELLRNPPILKKLQDELERVVGMGRMVRESDFNCLVYLQAVVKETLRLHPPAPLAVPHLSTEACNVLGYEIPQNTRVLVNLWAIGRNPKSWEDAERFVPERFTQGESIDEKLQKFEWIPFGAGRRACPGEQLGMLVVQFAVAQLVHCFDWSLPGGQQLDMSERFNGATVPRAHELLAIPTPRLPVVL